MWRKLTDSRAALTPVRSPASPMAGSALDPAALGHCTQRTADGFEAGGPDGRGSQ